MKPPFRKVVQVRSNGYVQGLPSVVKYQKSSYQPGQHAHRLGPDVEEQRKGMTFFLFSFGANGSMKGEVSAIHQNVALEVRHPLQTLFLLPGELPAPKDSPTSWKTHTNPLGPAPLGLETLSTSPSLSQCLTPYWSGNTLCFVPLFPR